MARLALTGLVAAAALISAGPGQAAAVLFGSPLDTAPWCVVYNIGADVIAGDAARMPSFEACNRERALAGHRPRSAGRTRRSPATGTAATAAGRAPNVRKHRKARR